MNVIHNKTEKRANERLKLVTARIRVFIWPERELKNAVEGMAFVADLSKDGIGVYIEEEIKVMRRTWVAFENPQAAPFEGKLMWCQRYAFEHNPFKQKELQFRAGLKLVFGTDAERKRYLTYLQELKNRIMGKV